ncbi:7729_t:CDS:2, partial [Dentiscutata erythropus]
DRNHDEDSIIDTDNLISTLVISEISELITDELTNSQRYRSPVCKQFSLLENEKKANCNYCKNKLSHKKGNGTSHFQHHLKSYNKYQKSASNSNSSSLPEGQTQLDLSLFVKRPSKISKKPGFRKFLNGVLPNLAISADIVKRDIMNSYGERKAF